MKKILGLALVLFGAGIFVDICTMYGPVVLTASFGTRLIAIGWIVLASIPIAGGITMLGGSKRRFFRKKG